MSTPNQPPERSPGDLAASPIVAFARAQLAEQIARLTREGYVVVSQTETTAQLRRRKHFSIFWALFWLVIGAGVGLFLYVAWYALVKRDKTASLYIAPDGQLVLTEG